MPQKKKNALIITSLVSEAPVQLLPNLFTARLKKCRWTSFVMRNYLQHESEMQTIFRNAFDNYIINENKMLHYADLSCKKERYFQYSSLEAIGQL